MNETTSTMMKPKTGADDLHEFGGRAKDMAKDKMDQVRTGAADAADRIQDKAQDMERSVEKFVREEPMKSLLIAAGIGIILGRFLMR